MQTAEERGKEEEEKTEDGTTQEGDSGCCGAESRVCAAFCRSTPFSEHWDEGKWLACHALAACEAVYKDTQPEARSVLQEWNQQDEHRRTTFQLGKMFNLTIASDGDRHQQELRVTTKDTLFVAFRGSKNASDWRENFYVVAHKHSAYNGCYVHKGFRRRAGQVKLNQILNRCTHLRKYRLTFTGHSLGGAVATLCALRAKRIVQRSSKYSGIVVDCVTFGAPAVADRTMVGTAQRHAWDSDFVNFVNAHDCVPGILNMRSTLEAIRSEMSLWERLCGHESQLATALQATFHVVSYVFPGVAMSANIAVAAGAVDVLMQIAKFLVKQVDIFVPFAPHVFLPGEDSPRACVECIRSPTTVRAVLQSEACLDRLSLHQHELQSYIANVLELCAPTAVPHAPPGERCDPFVKMCVGDLVHKDGEPCLRVQIQLPPEDLARVDLTRIRTEIQEGARRTRRNPSHVELTATLVLHYSAGKTRNFVHSEQGNPRLRENVRIVLLAQERDPQTGHRPRVARFLLKDLQLRQMRICNETPTNDHRRMGDPSECDIAKEGDKDADADEKLDEEYEESDDTPSYDANDGDADDADDADDDGDSDDADDGCDLVVDDGDDDDP